MSSSYESDVVKTAEVGYRAAMSDDEDPSRPTALWSDAWRGVLFATSRTLQIAEPQLIERAGFPLTWLDVLAQLYDAPEHGLRMQELEQRSLFTRSGLTRVVDRIEAAGLVRREAVPGDRRGVRVVLTPEGRRRHDAAFVDHLKVIEREFGRRLTHAQQQAVAEALATFWHDDGPAAEG
jgi:DNA-binding MarR family transcriptional regulator